VTDNEEMEKEKKEKEKATRSKGVRYATLTSPGCHHLC